MQIIRRGRKTIVMDGAHNQQKTTTFIKSFNKLYPGAKPAVLVALKDDKDYKKVAPVLAALGGRFVVTTFEAQQDLVVRSADPATLAAALKDSGAQNILIEPDQRKAFQALMSGSEDLCLVTGSFYLLSQIRHNEGLYD